MKKLVRPLHVIPRGYGVAYRSFNLDGSVCYPMPLNWLVRWALAAYIALRIPPVEKWMAAEYERGRAAGYRAGYDHGRNDGAQYGA